MCSGFGGKPPTPPTGIYKNHCPTVQTNHDLPYMQEFDGAVDDLPIFSLYATFEQNILKGCVFKIRLYSCGSSCVNLSTALARLTW